MPCHRPVPIRVKATWRSDWRFGTQGADDARSSVAPDGLLVSGHRTNPLREAIWPG